MQKNKILLTIITIMSIIATLKLPVYANQEIEETSLTEEEINNILETATTLDEVPVINSRNAVIYDRISRRSNLWKERKCKM